MIVQLDEKQMEAIVDQKIAELKKAGFNPKNITVATTFDNQGYKATVIQDFDDLRHHYKSNIRRNLVNMKEVARSAEVVAKFSNVSHEFKSGAWLETFANSPIKDPVVYSKLS